MSNGARLWLPAILVAAALTACGGNPEDAQGDMTVSESDDKSTVESGETSGMSATEETTATGGMQGMDMSSMLMEDGEYSDELFIDSMVPHHRAAVEEARVALENTDRAQLRELARNIISSQEREIEELRRIKEEEFGTREVPAGMSDEEMQMMGMAMTPEELAQAEPFDRAFIDNMIPHHQSAIDMSQVAVDNSDNEEIVEIANEIIEAQRAEIQQMEQWREEWYPNG